MPSSRRRYLWSIALIVVLAGALLAWRGRKQPVVYSTVAVDRGDIVDLVGATGLLQAVITVQVGSQVSGTIKELHADFNSNVKKGQVIALLEQSSFIARVNQSKANLASSRANVERSQAAIADAKQKYDRSLELAKQNLVPQSDLESAKATYDGAVAQHQADLASVKQAEAALNQAQVDLDHTVITAPVDGVVLARNVDVGQTVAASFQAPVLFVIANDLSQMQVNASIDEADIGRVRAGQDVTFSVDAYPEQTFRGRVDQVRLQPVTTQNVVTYNTIITVDNAQLRLMPGMTATVSVIVRNRPNAVRVANAALRFRPEGYPERRAGGQGGPGTAGAPAAGAPATAGGPVGVGSRPGGPGGFVGAAAADARGNWRGRMQGGSGADPRGAGGGGPRPGLVFVLGPDGQPKASPVKLGISDGRYTEIVDGLSEGAQVVTGVEEGGGGGRAPQAGSPTNNPFTPQRPQPRNR